MENSFWFAGAVIGAGTLSVALGLALLFLN
jgi:hypothetical protein